MGNLLIGRRYERFQVGSRCRVCTRARHLKKAEESVRLNKEAELIKGDP